MSRIPVKSLLFAFFGVAACLFAGALVQANEDLAGRRQLAAERLANVRTADPQRVDPQNEGQLVRVTGLATTDQELEDPLFGVRATALLLERKVETFQWVETGRDESWKYSQEWLEGLHDSLAFAEPEGHENPAEARFPWHQETSKSVTLGAFDVPQRLITSFPDRAQLRLTSLAALPEELRAEAKLVDDRVFFGADAQAPVVGDTRVYFIATPPARVHLLGRQKGNSFEHFGNKGGIRYLVMRLEEVPLFPYLERIGPVRIWSMRALGTALLAAGFLLLRAALPAARRPSAVAAICLAPAVLAAIAALRWSAFSTLYASIAGAFSLTALLAALVLFRRTDSPN